MTRFAFFVFLLLCCCQSSNDSDAGWQKIFQNEANGEVIFGDKTMLIDAVRLGYPIRVGWGGNCVEHIAEAEFLTIFEGKDTIE